MYCVGDPATSNGIRLLEWKKESRICIESPPEEWSPTATPSPFRQQLKITTVYWDNPDWSNYFASKLLLANLSFENNIRKVFKIFTGFIMNVLNDCGHFRFQAQLCLIVRGVQPLIWSYPARVYNRLLNYAES